MRSSVIDDREPFDYLLKIILIGDVAVGKTNLVTRYTTKAFNIESKTTVGVEFSMTTIHKDDKTIRVQIWDTSGQETYKSVARNYFKGAHGAIVVYDITNHKSFEHVGDWLKEINEAADLSPVMMMVGNKCDLDNLREVQQEEAIRYAKETGVAFIETSALDMTHVEVAFENIINEIYSQVVKTQGKGGEAERRRFSGGIKIPQPSAGVVENRKSCCV
eukprot:TRINITY_DN6682_c0_g1_i10.p1 TRINITY_DN6682_c0_g1~~TRINITY_DN6682_c0_g1_i10.p1  ORF type:complete len:218 (+),score=44.99 TRINITY_DN6682_c0_g1_i10:125-778(+)